MIEHFLAALDARMRAEIARAPAALPARGLLDAGGKRLRAQLLWWSANACAQSPLDPEDERLIRSAAVIELAHLGSLIHDDIVDGGETRRGIPTLHHQCGVRIAADAGTALAHLANELVASLGRPARQAVRRAILATCRGQLRELAVPFIRITPRARLVIMHEKTAAFFELAAALGALASDASRSQRTAVRCFARRFGVAFQIADDVLDLAGDPEVLGRSNGADLRDGVMTLPILLAADPQGDLTRTLHRVQLSGEAEAIAACAGLIEHGGGVAAAASVARWWLEEAVHALEPLPPTPALVQLIAIARTSVTRGLRLGRPSFATTAPGPTTVRQLGDWSVEARMIDAISIPSRLSALLRWFQPGLPELIATRACSATVQSHYAHLRHTLRQHDNWSPAAAVAADAIALSGALTADQSLMADPAHVLALIDPLQCAAIALLNDEAAPHEQALMAARTHQLGAPQQAPSTAFEFRIPLVAPAPVIPLTA